MTALLAHVLILISCFYLLPVLQVLCLRGGRGAWTWTGRVFGVHESFLDKGGANPAAPGARSLGSCRGTWDIVPLCARGSRTGKWTYAFRAHLGLCHASRCLPSSFLHPKSRKSNRGKDTESPQRGLL